MDSTTLFAGWACLLRIAIVGTIAFAFPDRDRER
jgi:hypothetical protein